MKKSRRATNKYSALDPAYSLKTRADELDFDYVNKLPEIWVDPKTGKKHNPKEYLNNFVNEYVHTDFRNKKRVHKKKKAPHKKNKNIKKLLTDMQFNIKEFVKIVNNANVSQKVKSQLKKNIQEFRKIIQIELNNNLKFLDDYYKNDAETRNNRRNSDMQTRGKAQGKLLNVEDVLNLTNGKNFEDDLIDLIDAKKLKSS